MKKTVFVLTIIVGLISASFTATSPETEATAPVVGVRVGNEAPELKFKDPDGKEISLKSLRGKIVLLDFWASWCGPCRRSNPHLVQVYNKYKTAKFKTAKGFEIYSVSLDKSAVAWKRAIEKDNLTWNNHVSDLKGWGSEAAAAYNVRSIPAAFLIDENGIILANGQQARHPQLLQQAIDNHVKKFK